MTYRWQALPIGTTGALKPDPHEEGMPGLTYLPEAKGGQLGKRLSVHPDLRRVVNPDQVRTMSIKETGPQGGVGKLIHHDSDFTLRNVTQHFGNPEQAYRVIKNVGETGKGREVFLHMQGDLQSPSRAPDELLGVEGQRRFSGNPQRLYQLNKEQHGVIWDKSDVDIARFAEEGWRGATTSTPPRGLDSMLGGAGEINRLEDECIETASFTSAGPIYKPSHKPGC